ncbi:MAG TPA: hypothetical protein VHD15_09835 [Hyphomicrobiales bacterium]|nr:hypothetical protein [Hyphomicrobiales bacterium]
MNLARLEELRPDQFRDRFGWMIGVAVLAVTLGLLVVEWRDERPGRLAGAGATAVLGLLLGGLLFVPALPRLAAAVELFAGRMPPPPSGPLPVASLDLTLPPPAEGGAPIVARLWLPATTAGLPPPGCVAALAALRPAGNARVPIVLYAPAIDGTRDQNSLAAADLASHGYAVLAIDDISHDPLPPGADAETVATQKLVLDFSTLDAYAATVRRGGEKTRLEAEKALAALDRLQACATALPDLAWRERLDFAKVGFFGWSFGGSTAAEAEAIDPRVVAAVNMDGWLFGAAASGGLAGKPYFLMTSDYAIGADKLRSPDAGTRYYWGFTNYDLGRQHRLLAGPRGYGITIRNAWHESFSDRIFSRAFLKSWLTLDPLRAEAIVNAYLRAFFDTYLKGEPSPLLKRNPSPYPEVELLHTSAHWRKGTATAPTISAAGSK